MNHRLAAAAALALLFAAPAAAQDLDSIAAATPVQAISFLPVHAAFGFYAGDYERAIGQTVTAGLGASYFSRGDDEEDDEFGYSSVEAKIRYYPSGDVLNGMSFGLTAGPTFVSADDDRDGETEPDEDLTAIGIGFEIARSHLMGVDRHLYYAYGAGFKRLFVVTGKESGADLALPTLRLSIGYAF